jgi:hypothetical protein
VPHISGENQKMWGILFLSPIFKCLTLALKSSYNLLMPAPTPNPWELPSHTEARKPTYNNEKVGLRANETREFPSLDRAEKIAAGGEAEVYKVNYYDSEHYDRRYGWGGRITEAVKVFYAHEPVGGFDERIFALTNPAMVVATNARWADEIYHPKELLVKLNDNQRALEEMGFGPEYTLLALREAYVDWRQLDHAGFSRFIRARFQEKDLPVPPEVAKGGKFLLPEDFKGGLAKYINTVTGYLGRRYPQLGLPARVFPKIGKFGLIGDEEPRFAGRTALTMEFVDSTLERVILDGYESFAGGSGYSRQDEVAELQMVKALGDYLSQHAPIDRLTEVRTQLDILGAYGLVFGDLKPENIGITSGRELVLLDPSSCVRRGQVQDYCTPEYLPEGMHQLDGRMRNPREEYAQGELRAHPWFDQVALHKMTVALIQGGVQASMESLRRDVTEKQESHRAQMTARALKKLRN